MIATAHYLSITQPHGIAQRTWGLVGKVTTSDAQPIHQILCFAIKPQSTGHFLAEKVGFFPILELPHWIEFVVRDVSAAVAPKTPPYFCLSSGLSNCALPWAVLRRRKLGAADSSATNIEMSSSFAEIRELILRDE